MFKPQVMYGKEEMLRNVPCCDGQLVVLTVQQLFLLVLKELAIPVRNLSPVV